MNTIGEFVDTVRSNINSKGVPSDDIKLTDRFIYNKLSSAREMVISQSINNYNIVSNFDYQTLPCIEMVLSSFSDCPCFPEMGCKILKSKFPIPKMLSNYKKLMVKSIHTIDNSINYTLMDFDRVKTSKYAPLTGKKAKATIYNNHLFITSSGESKMLSMVALFSSPVEAYNFTNACATTNIPVCNFYRDMVFPIDSQHKESIINIVEQSIMSKFAQIRNDIQNDSKDE